MLARVVLGIEPIPLPRGKGPAFYILTCNSPMCSAGTGHRTLRLPTARDRKQAARPKLVTTSEASALPFMWSEERRSRDKLNFAQRSGRPFLPYVVLSGYAAFRSALESLTGPALAVALALLIFGFYSGFVYFTPVTGDLIADCSIVQRNAVVIRPPVDEQGHIAVAFDRTFLLALGGELISPASIPRIFLSHFSEPCHRPQVSCYARKPVIESKAQFEEANYG